MILTRFCRFTSISDYDHDIFIPLSLHVKKRIRMFCSSVCFQFEKRLRQERVRHKTQQLQELILQV